MTTAIKANVCLVRVNLIGCFTSFKRSVAHFLHRYNRFSHLLQIGHKSRGGHLHFLQGSDYASLP